MAAIQTDFLRGVTHDLQTPLTSIRALAAELQEKPDTDAIARVDLQTIAYQADRLRRMVGQLLVVSRLEVGAVRRARKSSAWSRSSSARGTRFGRIAHSA